MKILREEMAEDRRREPEVIKTEVPCVSKAALGMPRSQQSIPAVDHVLQKRALSPASQGHAVFPPHGIPWSTLEQAISYPKQRR